MRDLRLKFKKGEFVHDTWWPWRGGVVTTVKKTRLRVLFLTGGGGCDTKTYDSAHAMNFLVKENRGGKHEKGT